jgi:CarD family transcriptional regulator
MTTQQKKSATRHGFKTGEYDRLSRARRRSDRRHRRAGSRRHKLELFVIDFEKDKMRLKVPVAKAVRSACASCRRPTMSNAL